MYQFINPYNFIPLGDRKTICPPSKEKGMTGYIVCELETRTPLIMIDTSKETLKKVCTTEKTIDHKVYDSTTMIGGTPVIPASELRGMIRSKFETLTNSCMSSLEEELEFYSRYKGDMSNAGILDLSDKDNVKLYECNAKDVSKERKSFEKFRTGKKVKYKGEIGYVRHGREFAGKSAVHFFVETKKQVSADNEKDFGRMFEEIKDIYKEHLSKEKIKEHEALSSSNMQPVWYEKVKVDNNQTYVYFSLGQNGQTKSRKVLRDLVTGYLPCKDKENLCEACQMFGTIQQNPASGEDTIVHSKIRVEDAYLEEECMEGGIEQCYKTKKPVVLEELSSPKYTNPMFYMRLVENGYLVSGEAKYSWGVDFCSEFKRGKYKIQPMTGHSIMIRGRKEYWHHDPLKRKPVNDPEETERNVSVRPLKEGLKYTFKIYFDDITKKQLEDLQLAISLGESKDAKSDYCHKLGMGKPLGYGSVKVKVKEIKVRKLNENWEYAIEDYIPEAKYIEEHFQLKGNVKKALMHMYDFNFIKNNPAVKVDYPRNEEGGFIYEWFIDHKKTVLPFAESEYDKLIQKGEKKQKNYNETKNNFRHKG